MRFCLCMVIAGLTIAAAVPATAATSAPVATALAASESLSQDTESTAPEAADDSSDATGATYEMAGATAGATRSSPGHAASNASSREQVYSLGATPDEDGGSFQFEMPAFDTDHDGKVQCVELLKGLMNAPRTIFWKPGRSVMDNDDIKPGTAIATFVNGQYPQGPIKGSKHAAIFLKKVKDGIYVLDQYVGQKLAKTRFIPWYNHTNDKRSNNGHSFSTVIW